MFTDNDIKTISSCVSNYVEQANNQIANLTVGDKDFNTLYSFLESKINDCYEVQKKLNAIVFIDGKIHANINQKEVLTLEEIESLNKSLNKIIKQFKA